MRTPWLAFAFGVLVACSGSGGSSATDAMGTVDAPGPDATTVDARELDAPAVDAPEPDAAIVDARELDAPAVDASELDARIDAPYVADASPCGIAPSAAPITSPQAQTPWVPTGWGQSSVAVFSLTAPMALASLSYEMLNHDADLTVRATCNGAVLSTGTTYTQTVDGFQIVWTSGTAPALPAGTFLIEAFVGFVWGNTAYLDVRGVIADGEACTGPLVASGVLACSATAQCQGGVCVAGVCSNGLDDDGDGLADAADPGCATGADPDEQDGCASGGACAQCADGVDTDGDGLAGWPQDLGCAQLGDLIEHNCPDTESVEVTTSAVHPVPYSSGSDHPAVPHCHDVGPDKTFHLVIPGDLSALRVGVGQDAISLTLFRDACHLPPDRCQPGAPGQSSSNLGPVAAGDYWLVARPRSTGASISIAGTFAAGEPCDPARPVFVCPTAQACLPDAAGGHRCQ